MSQNTNTTSAAVATIDDAATEATIEAVLARTGGDPIAQLREAYATAQTSEKAHRKSRDDAEHGMKVAMVWQARIAYRTATLDGIAKKPDFFNITGAAKALGIPVGTLRPYALAGQALHKADRAGMLSEPAKEDLAIVDDSFDRTSRADQKLKRVREAARKATLEAKARELEALKAKQAGTPEGAQAPAQAPEGQSGTPAGTPASTPASGQQAPAQAPAGVSLEDDVMATAKTLVAQIKKLRADKGWAKVSAKVVGILAEAFPVLGK